MNVKSSGASVGSSYQARSWMSNHCSSMCLPGNAIPDSLRMELEPPSQAMT